MGDCKQRAGESWNRRAAAFSVGTGGGLAALRDLSQPDLKSRGPLCHGRLPHAPDSLGEQRASSLFD